MRTIRRRNFIAVCCAGLLAIVASATVNAGDPNVPDVIEAVWKTQRMDFEYHSSNAYYSCPALEQSLRRILIGVGAHPDIDLHTQICADNLAIVRFQVTLQSPVPATEQTVRELTTYDARDELAARVRGERLPPADQLPRFRAEWKTISFARDRTLKLGPADCELVQQLRDQVLPKLSVRVLADIHCTMMARDTSPPRLTVSALIASRDPLARDD